jgi:hypothetical protein
VAGIVESLRVSRDSPSRVEIRKISAKSDLIVNVDVIQLSVSFEIECEGAVPAHGVDWHMTLLPLAVPFIPTARPVACRPAGLDKFLYPAAPERLLRMWCDRAARLRQSSTCSSKSMKPGESCEAGATLGLDTDLLYEGGTFFEDGSLVPLIYTCTSYLCGDKRGFRQLGQAFQLRARDPSRPETTCDPVLERFPIPAHDLIIIRHNLTPTLQRLFLPQGVDAHGVRSGFGDDV